MPKTKDPQGRTGELPPFIAEWDSNPANVLTRRIIINGKATYEVNDNFERLFGGGKELRAESYNKGGCPWRDLVLSFPGARQESR
jgi:hypothetical protein